MSFTVTPPVPQRPARWRTSMRVRAHLCFAGSMALMSSSALLAILSGASGGLAERLWRRGDRLRERALGLFTLSHPLAAALLRVRAAQQARAGAAPGNDEDDGDGDDGPGARN